MSWSYSGDPTSSEKDALRFLVGDTDIKRPVMQDEEILYLVDTYGTNDALLKYQLFTHVATIFARDYKRSLGPQAEDPTERLKYFRDQAAIYKAKSMAAGISIPDYAYPKIFRKGMQSNPPWPRKRHCDV